jgi:hypothetical protein
MTSAFLDTETYWYKSWDKLPSYDLNRAIVEPGKDLEYPQGALGIYADDDFYCVGVLPYEMRHYDFKTIVQILWPNHTPKIRPDHGDPIIRELYQHIEDNRCLREALYRGCKLLPLEVIAKTPSHNNMSTMYYKLHVKNYLNGKDYRISRYHHESNKFPVGLKFVAAGIVRKNTIQVEWYSPHNGSHTFKRRGHPDLIWAYTKVA